MAGGMGAAPSRRYELRTPIVWSEGRAGSLIGLDAWNSTYVLKPSPTNSRNWLAILSLSVGTAAIEGRSRNIAKSKASLLRGMIYADASAPKHRAVR